MDAPASSGAARGGRATELLERVLLAAFGAAVLTADRIEELAGGLSDRGAMRRDEARQFLEDAATRWKGDSARLAERAGEGMHGVFHQVGLVTQEEFDELELRLAQLEHRLRLAEARAEAAG